MIYSYSEYRKFLERLKSLGNCVTFSEHAAANSFLLRFDVDFDLLYAYRIAKINEENNVKATFFILTTCHFYNIFSKTNRNLIRSISDTGAEIGLHFDPTIYPHKEENELKEEVDFESSLLSKIVQKQIKAISLHNPSIHNLFPQFDGFINAYDPQFFKDSAYISDSCMNFRGKDLMEFIKKINKESIQITLHPMHYSKFERGYDDIMVEHIVRYTKEIDKNFLANFTYVEQVKPDLLLKFKEKIES